MHNMHENIPGHFRSLIAALVLVSIAMIGLLYFEDPVAERQWPAIAAPVIPAVYVLPLFFTGGAHGIGWGRDQQELAVFGIALLMWWIVMEVCRRVWGVLHSRTHAP